MYVACRVVSFVLPTRACSLGTAVAGRLTRVFFLHTRTVLIERTSPDIEKKIAKAKSFAVLTSGKSFLHSSSFLSPSGRAPSAVQPLSAALQHLAAALCLYLRHHNTDVPSLSDMAARAQIDADLNVRLSSPLPPSSSFLFRHAMLLWVGL